MTLASNAILRKKNNNTEVTFQSNNSVAHSEPLESIKILTAQSKELIADILKMNESSVHKMEKQADLYLSTLRRFVEAVGGTLEIRVELPGKGVVRLTGLGDLR